MAHDLWSDAVGNRMQRLACFEAHRLGGASVQVNATDGGGVWRVLQWPAEGLAYWLETTSPLRS